MLRTSNPTDWEPEFVRLVQDIVQQDAGWAWDGFWHMVLHNVQHPSCAVRRPPDTVVSPS